MRALLAVTLLAAAAAAGIAAPASADCTPMLETPSVWVPAANSGYSGGPMMRCDDGPVAPCALVVSTDPMTAGDGLVQVGSAAVYNCYA